MTKTRSRKTVEVAGLLARVNRALTDFADYQDKMMGVACARVFRQGMAVVLEDALHASGNYHGFRYTDPKAEYDDTGIVAGTYDETRRMYYS